MKPLLEKLAFSPLAWPLVWGTGNGPAQRLLGGVFHVVQHLMGIGPGASVGASGERALLQLLRRRGSKPYTVLDVGANVGAFAELFLARLPAAELMVHCFEPAAQTFQRLQAALGARANVRLNNAALGAAAGTATLYYDEPCSEQASLSRREAGKTGQAFRCAETVAVQTLDGYCRAQGLARLDLLKLDVEGHELDVLAGARETFAAGKVAVCTFEFGAANLDSRTYFRDLFKFFAGQKMAIHRLTRSGYLFPIPVYHEKHEQFRTTNFVACRP